MASQMRQETVARVFLWGHPVGAVAWDAERRLATFEYQDAFIRSGLQVAPITIPPRRGIFSFPSLNQETFRGLPGLLADSLPDRFGNRLIDLWLQQQGRSLKDFSPVERLCYIGSRGMGALEFKPALTRQFASSNRLEVAELAELARDILADRFRLSTNLRRGETEALNTIIRVGTSAGGARAKAVINWNRQTGEIRSGQVAASPGFEPWILKFDGVHDTSLGDPEGFGRIEFAYHRMAVAAGIQMSECHLLEEGGRAHFMTRRFDRANAGSKIHMQSLCAMAHYDFNEPGAYGYEQALSVIQQLNLGYPALQEMFRRMVFNVLARNQDDHTRNIAFLMESDGRWRLAPAFDAIWAYKTSGGWTSRHQMRVNGKQDGFDRSDLLAVASQFGIKGAAGIIDVVAGAVSRWPEFASESGVEEKTIRTIGNSHRLNLALQ
ncbi:MAG: type II toxin-antitoxin system HipA family toxin [bacterium]